MAEKIETFPERQPRSKYPIDEWMDGGVWRLVRGEDFEQPLTAMRALLYAAARRTQSKVRSRALREGDREILTIQFESDGRREVARPPEHRRRAEAKEPSSA